MCNTKPFYENVSVAHPEPKRQNAKKKNMDKTRGKPRLPTLNSRTASLCLMALGNAIGSMASKVPAFFGVPFRDTRLRFKHAGGATKQKH